MPRTIDNIPMPTLQKKIDSPSFSRHQLSPAPQLEEEPQGIFPTQAGLLTGLILYKTHVGNQSYWVFISMLSFIFFNFDSEDSRYNFLLTTIKSTKSSLPLSGQSHINMNPVKHQIIKLRIL